MIKIREMINAGCSDEVIFNAYPHKFTLYGERIKSTCKQRRTEAFHDGNPHLWVHGYPGTGKTAILHFVYPKLFKKNLCNIYFDLYDPSEHTHVMLEDLDFEAVDKLGVNFVKTVRMAW